MTSANLLLAHAHYAYVYKEFLPERRRSFKQKRPAVYGSFTSDRSDGDNTDDSAQSLDGTPPRSSEESKMGTDFLAYYEHRSQMQMDIDQ